MTKKHHSSKESHSQLFKRYIWLVDLIYSRGRISFEEISERWSLSSLNTSCDELPLRTFHNHREAIQSLFDIDIVCDRKGGYQYYIENSKDIEGNGVREWIVSSFAVNNVIAESRKLNDRILFENIPSGANYLTSIIGAMRDSITLQITYQSFGRDSEHTFLLEPYCIKIFKQRWYVIGRSVSKNRVATYSLDRIHDLRQSSEKFSLPESFDGRTFFKDSFGIITSDDYLVEQVRIKVYGTKAKYIESLPLHHSQRLEEKADSYSIFSYYIKPTYDFRQELLSHGAEVEVLSPEWLVGEIREIIKKQIEYYRI